MRAALDMVTTGHEERVMRSLASNYNCVGMAFANRRTCVEPEHLPMILREDGYVEVPQAAAVVAGDIVVYEQDGEISHVGTVVSNRPDLISGRSDIQVLSQWGFDGEYSTTTAMCIRHSACPCRFISERRMI